MLLLSWFEFTVAYKSWSFGRAQAMAEHFCLGLCAEVTSEPMTSL